MKILSMLAIGCQILVVSSSFGQKVIHDFDKNTNFEQFKTRRPYYDSAPCKLTTLKRSP